MRRFLVDNQLPAALAPWLESKGCAADHVLALQLAQSRSLDTITAPSRAARSQMMSSREDFAQMTLVRPEPVAVVWLRMGNCRTPALLAAMERAWPTIVQQLDTGARLIEVF